MNARRWIIGAIVTALVLVLGAAVVPAFAQGANTAVLYELTENMRLIGQLNTTRSATSALGGWITPGSSLCPVALATALGVDRCTINATASDKVSLSTGVGPVNGSFTITVQDTNPVDGAEVVVAKGTLSGNVDLSPAVLTLVPLGTITGRWSAIGVQGGPLSGLNTGGNFTGVFRLPFMYPALGAVYLTTPAAFPAPSSVTAIGKDEEALGVPTVRLEVVFAEGK